MSELSTAFHEFGAKLRSEAGMYDKRNPGVVRSQSQQLTSASSCEILAWSSLGPGASSAPGFYMSHHNTAKT
jgi:hypothetical protein